MLLGDLRDLGLAGRWHGRELPGRHAPHDEAPLEIETVCHSSTEVSDRGRDFLLPTAHYENDRIESIAGNHSTEWMLHTVLRAWLLLRTWGSAMTPGTSFPPRCRLVVGHGTGVRAGATPGSGPSARPSEPGVAPARTARDVWLNLTTVSSGNRVFQLRASRVAIRRPNSMVGYFAYLAAPVASRLSDAL